SGKSLKEPRKTTVSQSAPVSSAELSTAILQLANQWIATDSALNPFVQNFFARLPCSAPASGRHEWGIDVRLKRCSRRPRVTIDSRWQSGRCAEKEGTLCRTRRYSCWDFSWPL